MSILPTRWALTTCIYTGALLVTSIYWIVGHDFTDVAIGSAFCSCSKILFVRTLATGCFRVVTSWTFAAFLVVPPAGSQLNPGVIAFFLIFILQICWMGPAPSLQLEQPAGCHGTLRQNQHNVGHGHALDAALDCPSG